MPKRILFLMSDTGGGHRAAAEAIRDALVMKHGDAVLVDDSLVDVYRKMRFPMNTMPEFYPWIIKHGKWTWGVSYNQSNGKIRARGLSRWLYLTNSQRLKRMVREYPADVVVSVHSVLTQPSMRAYLSLPQRPPFITVVTDLVSTHHFWYDKHTEMCFVPTQAAYDKGLESGLRPDQLQITGLPVHPNFTKQLVDKSTARQTLGWQSDRPTILIIGGGEGMGPLYRTARAINKKALHCQLAIVAGRNEDLKVRLEAKSWHQPTHIYPFVTNMPVLMAGADILVTKAGPATITEACIAGLPMILYDAIPGQETGNVDFVVANDLGVYAPSPRKVANALEAWLGDENATKRRSENALRVARPDAVWRIADAVWDYAQMPPIRVERQVHRP